MYSNTKIINGKVINKNSNELLPFVNIYIKNSTFGVISNLEGVFQINILEKHTNGVLVFSAIGFETLEINVSNLNANVFEIIKLKESTVALDEVVIRTKKYSTNEIVRKAFDNYYINFASQPFISKGFIRHTEKTKKEYKWLIEAAIEVYDPGFNKSSKKIRTNISEVRKSFDNRFIDTLGAYRLYLNLEKGFSVRKAWVKNLDNVSELELQKAVIHHDNYFTIRGWKQTFFYSLFSTDHNKLRYYRQNNAILNKKVLMRHKFQLDTIVIYTNKEVYKIKILPTSPPSYLNKFKKDNQLPIGWIYIRADDFAILELKYGLIESDRNSITSKIAGSKVTSIYHIKFFDFKGSLYPKYMSLMSPKGNRFMESIQMLNEEKTDSEIYYYSKQEIIFTEIITNKEEIQLGLQKPWNDDLFSPRPYNAEFWKDYNILLESNEQHKMIQDLEKKVKLKEQHKQSN